MGGAVYPSGYYLWCWSLSKGIVIVNLCVYPIVYYHRFNSLLILHTPPTPLTHAHTHTHTHTHYLCRHPYRVSVLVYLEKTLPPDFDPVPLKPCSDKK